MMAEHFYGKTTIKSFEAKELGKRSLGVRLADRLTAVFGSIPFFIVNLIIFVLWIAVNTGNVPGVSVFDPYPFVLLISFVSLEAIVLSIVVLMSQNRAGFISSLREEVHLQVNLIAEKEITKTLWILKKIAEKQGLRIEDKELDEMLKSLDESYIERRLSKELNTQEKSRTLKAVKKVAEEVSKITKPV